MYVYSRGDSESVRLIRYFSPYLCPYYREYSVIANDLRDETK